MYKTYQTPQLSVTELVEDVLKESDVLLDLSELGWGDYDEGGVKWGKD